MIKRYALLNLDKRLAECTQKDKKDFHGAITKIWLDDNDNMVMTEAPNGNRSIQLYSEYGDLFGAYMYKVHDPDDELSVKIQCATPFSECMKFVMSTY